MSGRIDRGRRSWEARRDASSATAHHVPELILAVPDLLRSLNGKPSEAAMRNAINGAPNANPAGLANPALYDMFASIPARHARGPSVVSA